MLVAILLSCLSVAGCDDVRVYGSVTHSSFSGHHGGFGSSVTVGGRIR
jgi:hypothetical protein